MLSVRYLSLSIRVAPIKFVGGIPLRHGDRIRAISRVVKQRLVLRLSFVEPFRIDLAEENVSEQEVAIGRARMVLEV